MALSADQQRALVKQGKAMPGKGDDPARFPIRNRSDLEKAIRAVGRAKGSHADVRRFIIKRAKALGLSNLIPSNWNADGSLS